MGAWGVTIPNDGGGNVGRGCGVEGELARLIVLDGGRRNVAGGVDAGNPARDGGCDVVDEDDVPQCGFCGVGGVDARGRVGGVVFDDAVVEQGRGGHASEGPAQVGGVFGDLTVADGGVGTGAVDASAEELAGVEGAPSARDRQAGQQAGGSNAWLEGNR